ncbi:adenylate cyclase associated N terminal-domain-containing protein, partial [Amylostereum chailletii]
ISPVVHRLEAVTSRLEDICNRDFTNAAEGIVGVPTIATGSAAAPPPAPTVIEDPPSVVAFETQVLNGKVKPFVKLTESFAIPIVVEQSKLVEKLYNNVSGLIRTAALCKKPDQKAFATLLTDLQKDVEAITQLKDANRKERDWFNHLSFLAEGAPAVAWVTLESKPGPYVSEVKESSQFYGNRIIKEFKEKDAKHVEWVRAYIAIFDEMKKYVMEYHTTGLVWNAKGISITEYKATPAPAAGGVPPPPPPPPPPAPAPPPPPPTGATPAAGGGVAAVFTELNRGEDVTKGLRKVDKSEMTHKNPALRASSIVPSSTPSPSSAPKRPTKPTKPQALMSKKPAKFALEGNKWVIENQENESALTVDQTEISQTVNLFACKNITVIIKGKVNAVTLINCKKTSILVDSVISSVSVTASPSFTLQITGAAPTIQLDSTDSGQIYLSKHCLGVEITTAKCSSINVSLPVEGEEDGVFEEKAMPEMLLTKVQDGKLVTSVVEHVG